MIARVAKFILTFLLVVGVFLLNIYTPIVAKTSEVETPIEDELQVQEDIDNKTEEEITKQEEVEETNTIIEEEIEKDIPLDTYIVEEESAPLLNANEGSVSTAAELKTMIESNNGITTIYLKNDIQLSGGITVPSTKSELTIDGKWEGTNHRLIENNNGSISGNIYLNNSVTKTTTLRNMQITGYNYYGTITVGTAIKGVTNIYDNVTYNGPQLVHNNYGTAHFKDTTITIEKLGSSPAQEVGELTNVEYSGMVIINHSTTDHVYWLKDNGYTKVHDYSLVEINSGTSPLYYGYSTTLDIGIAANFSYTGQNVKFNNSNNKIGDINIAEFGSFNMYMQSTSATDYIIYNSGNINIKQGGTLRVETSGEVTNTLFYRQDATEWVNSGNMHFNFQKKVAAVTNGGNLSIDAGVLAVNTSTIGSTKDLFSFNNVILNGGMIDIKENVSNSSSKYVLFANTMEVHNADIIYNAYDGGKGIGVGSFVMDGVSSYTYNATVASGNALTVADQGRFDISGKSSIVMKVQQAKQPLITSGGNVNIGIGTTFQLRADTIGANMQLLKIDGTITINKPHSFYIASPNSPLSYVSTSNLFHFEGEQILMWTSYFAPEEVWARSKELYYENAALESYFIKGVLNVNAQQTVQNVSSSYANEATSSGNPATQFTSVGSLKVLAIGDAFSLDSVVASSGNSFIEGKATPNANISIVYDGTLYEGKADETGNFHIPTGVLKVGTSATVVVSEQDYLHSKNIVEITSSGTLSLSNVPELMSFGSVPIPNKETWVERESDTWSIQVSDTRSTRSGWKLYATATEPTSVTGKTLPNLLQFVDESGKRTIGSTPILIHSDDGLQENTTITWEKDKGILMRLLSGEGYRDTSYEAEITWHLVDAP